MDIMTMFYVVVYFTIGWFLSDWLNTDGNDEVAVFIFVFWPLLIVMLGCIIVTAVAMFVSILASKLMNVFDKGGNSNGSV